MTAAIAAAIAAAVVLAVLGAIAIGAVVGAGRGHRPPTPTKPADRTTRRGNRNA